MRRRPFSFFFDHHLNLGAKFRTEIELLSLSKLRKKVSPPWNWLNQQKFDAYDHWCSNIQKNEEKKNFVCT